MLNLISNNPKLFVIVGFVLIFLGIKIKPSLGEDSALFKTICSVVLLLLGLILILLSIFYN